MPTYSLYQVDAFTTTPLGGNPCAVVFDCADLDDAAMLAIAREMNLSETAFVWKKPDGHFRARYFTPAEEIPLAGRQQIRAAARREAYRHVRRAPVSRQTKRQAAQEIARKVAPRATSA